MRHALGLLLLAVAAPAAQATTEGPITRLATVGGRPDVLARADGSAVGVWEEKPTASTANVHFCRIAAGGGTCAAGSEKTLAASAGATTSRPFVFDLSGNRIVVVHGGCCAQHTYEWISADGGSTFGLRTDFASIVPFDQGAAVGPGDVISLLGDPVSGTVGYQRADPTAAKTTAEATLDTAAGLTFAQAVAIDPGTGKPFALWASSADAFSSYATGTNLNLTASWTAPPAKLAGVSGMRLAGAYATWVKDGHHEVAKWTGSGFGAAVQLRYAPADSGQADIATDPSGGVHVVYNPATTGDLCYAYAPDGVTFGAPRLLGRDTGGVAGLQVSATGDGKGRVVFSTATAAGPVSVLPLSSATLTPNTCGLALGAPALAKPVGTSDVIAGVDPNGQDTTFHVEFGPTTDYGTSTPDIAAPAAAGPATSTIALPGLAPGTTYHARVVATNVTGSAASADLSFTTAPVLARLKASDLVRLPGRCTHRRLTLKLLRPAGATPTSAVIRATGRRALRLGAKKLGRPGVVLTGLARRRVKVAVKLRLADGRIFRVARTYARCAP